MFRVTKPVTSSISRRSVLLGGAALFAVSAAGPAFAGSVSSFVDGVWKDAKARGVSRKTFDVAMGGFKPIPKVVELSQKQPEVIATAGDYVTKRVTEKQTGTGQAMSGEWAKTLAKVASTWGVQPEAVLAIWGIETNFGGYMGGAADRAAGPRFGQQDDWLVGRCDGPPAVHALEFHALRRRLQGRWAQGHLELGPRCNGVNRQLPQELRLA